MHTKILRSLTVFFLLFMLSSCNKTAPSQKDYSSPLLPMRNEYILPTQDSGDVKSAMNAYFMRVNAPSFSQYNFVRIDLNGDHLKEALVYITTPYGHWCNTKGCSLVILRAHINGFSSIGNFKGVRPPFYVSKRTYGDWHDLITETSGDVYKKSGTSILRFDRNEYKHQAEPPYAFSRAAIKSVLFP